MEGYVEDALLITDHSSLISRPSFFSFAPFPS